MRTGSRDDAATSRVENFAWGAAVLAVLLWAAASLTWPFGLDQGIFAWVGDTILRGGAPYKDAWEIKGPAIHYLYAFAQLLFGRGTWGLRIVDLVALAGAAVAAAAWARNLVPLAERVRAGRFAALFTVLFYAGGGYWNAAQPDAFAAWAWLAAAALATSVSPGLLAWFTVGVLCAFAALCKPPFALLGLLLIAHAAYSVAATERRVIFLHAAAASAAGLLALLGAAALAFALQGALDDLIEVQLVFNPRLHPTAYRSLSGPEVAGVFGRWALQPPVALALLMTGAGVWRSWERSRPNALLYTAALLLALLLVVLQNQFFAYHFIPVLGVLGVGAAVGCARWMALDKAWFSRSATAAALLLVALLAWAPFQQLRSAAESLRSEQARAEYRSRFGMGSYSFAAMEEIAQHLRSKTAEGDAIFVFGFEAGLYFLADRPASTRFGFAYPLIRGGGSDIEAAYLEEFSASWRATTPAYVLLFEQALSPDLPSENRAALEDMSRLLEACYERDLALEGSKLKAWVQRETTQGCVRSLHKETAT